MKADIDLHVVVAFGLPMLLIPPTRSWRANVAVLVLLWVLAQFMIVSRAYDCVVAGNSRRAGYFDAVVFLAVNEFVILSIAVAAYFLHKAVPI